MKNSAENDTVQSKQKLNEQPLLNKHKNNSEFYTCH